LAVTKVPPNPAFSIGHSKAHQSIRDAIRAGRVFAGMTKDQVLLSLGRPRVDFVPSLSANEWKYEIPEQEEMYFVFDESGALREIDGSRKARKLVVYEGSQ
jgi:outer membrane protein assembly factor BamE (lipoprotein component of BamABCDE complex)